MKRAYKIFWILLLVLIPIFPLSGITYGVDISDVGFSLNPILLWPGRYWHGVSADPSVGDDGFGLAETMWCVCNPGLFWHGDCVDFSTLLYVLSELPHL